MRPTDVPDQGLLCDLLWADPDKETMGWGENDRGVSFTFGPEIVTKYLHKHDMDLICRAHQVGPSSCHWSCLPSHYCLVSLLSFRWWRTVMSSLPSVSWWRCSLLQTTVANLTMPVQWWAWMRHWCAHFRYICHTHRFNAQATHVFTSLSVFEVWVVAVNFIQRVWLPLLTDFEASWQTKKVLQRTRSE